MSAQEISQRLDPDRCKMQADEAATSSWWPRLTRRPLGAFRCFASSGRPSAHSSITRSVSAGPFEPVRLAEPSPKRPSLLAASTSKARCEIVLRGLQLLGQLDRCVAPT